MPRGLELLIAQTILQGFDAQYGRFLEVTSGAQQRFEQADWHAVQQAMKNRIHLYDHHVGLVVEQLRCITNGQSTDAAFLLRVKEHYTRLLPDYPRFEIAESFFNSVYCRLFDHRSLTPERLFIFSSQPERRFRTIPRPLAKDFHPDHGWESLLMRVISDLPLRLRWQNKSRDIHYIVRHLTETLGTDNLAESHLQVANELFYRNKAAWLVGKLITPSGTLPFLLPIHQTDDGELFIDISQGKSGTDASQDESGLTTPPPGCTVQENKFGSFDEQKNDESSIYNYYRKAISIKASCPEIAEGVSTADKTLNKGSISAVKKTMKTKDDGENSCVILYNISDKEQTLELNLNENGLRLCAELETGSEKVHVSENKIEIPAWGIAVIK